MVAERMAFKGAPLVRDLIPLLPLTHPFLATLPPTLNSLSISQEGGKAGVKAGPSSAAGAAAGGAPRYYTRAEVGKHKTPETGIWVTYKNGVYDITDFVKLHPGGNKVLLAAGSSVDPFWAIYQQHNHAHVHETLEKYRIGEWRGAGCRL